MKVQAASVNALDWHMLTADIFLVRMSGAGPFKPKNPILGADIAGRVEAVGKYIRQFKPGDEVFGDIGHGGFAEYALGREKQLVLKPANLSFEQAAAVPVAGLTALQGIRDSRKIQPGQKVLINGAAGGVGTFAIQIAKTFGAEVTAVSKHFGIEATFLVLLMTLIVPGGTESATQGAAQAGDLSSLVWIGTLVWGGVSLVMLVPWFFLMRSIGKSYPSPEWPEARLSLNALWSFAALMVAVMVYFVSRLSQGAL